MSRGDRLIVVGGGQAAAQIIDSARREGYEGAITLVTDEPMLPYQRPPLSKQYLRGGHDADWLLYRFADFYPRNAVDVRLGARAVSIDRDRATVRLEDGEELAYDKLALTTGARARRLPIGPRASDRIFYIRTLDDIDRLRGALPDAQRIAIIGGGFIGLETAAVLRKMGRDVTVIASNAHIIPKVIAAEMSRVLLDRHLMAGVEILLEATVAEIEDAAPALLRVLLADGRIREADIVIIGIGALPNIELAEAAGLDCNDGIIVDEYARTSDPAIFAAGDCTNHPNALIGRRLRLETVHNAVEQGRTAGATIAGKDMPYTQTPWVWSDQYDLRLQSVGISDGYDATVTRGDPASGRFSLFYYGQGRLLAVNCLNQPHVFGAARRILNEGIVLRPDQAADSAFDLGKLPLVTYNLEFDVPWPTRAEKGLPALTWGHG